MKDLSDPIRNLDPIGPFTPIAEVPTIMVPSDISFKENIKKIGTSVNGINVYSFNYIGSQISYQGVIAQELVGTKFESSLIKDENGKYLVDYSKIDVKFKEI